jgi:hypothetical protein
MKMLKTGKEYPVQDQLYSNNSADLNIINSLSVIYIYLYCVKVQFIHQKVIFMKVCAFMKHSLHCFD